MAIDWPATLKMLSTIGAGASGAMALLTEFKHKRTGRITRWGAFALIGLLVSTAVGLTTQVLESRDAAAKASSEASKAKLDAENTNYVVHTLASLSLPIQGSVWRVYYYLPCNKLDTAAICNAVDPLPAIRTFVGRDDLMLGVTVSGMRMVTESRDLQELGGGAKVADTVAFLTPNVSGMVVVIDYAIGSDPKFALSAMTDLGSAKAYFWIMPEKLRPYVGSIQLVSPKGVAIVLTDFKRSEIGQLIATFPEKPVLVAAETVAQLKYRAAHSIDDLPSD